MNGHAKWHHEMRAERYIWSRHDDAVTAAVIEGIKFVQNVIETDSTLFIRQKEMRLGERLDATKKCGLEIFDVVGGARGRSGDCLHHRERVLDAVVQFPHEQSVLL